MATAKFLTEARRADAPMIALVKVYLTSPSTKTLHLSSNYIETPDFQLWEGVIVALDPIRAPGSFLGPGPDPVTAGFSIASRSVLGDQPTGENFTNLVTAYRWIGAKVEVFLWSQRLTSIGDRQLVFSGSVQSYQVSSATIDVRCIQRQDYDKIISPIFVTRDRFPRAPDRSVGLPVPIVYGAIKSPALRAPWPSAYGTDQNKLEKALGGQLGVPAVMVDTGRGGSNQKMEFLIAAHPVKIHDSPTEGAQYYIDAADRLGIITPTELFSAAGGAGFRLGDDFAAAIMPVRFVEQAAHSIDPAINPAYAHDLFEETTFMTLIGDQPGGIRQGRRFRAESVDNMGKLVEAFLYVAWYPNEVGAGNFQFGTSKNGGGASAIVIGGTVGTPTVGSASLGVAWGGARMPDTPWNFSEIEVTFEWTTNVNPKETKFIFALGIGVVYKPKAKIYAPRQVSRPHFRRGSRGMPEFIASRELAPPDTEIESLFFATLEGMADDGSGTYTGSADALVERPCDIAHHLLRNYGGQNSGQVESGAGLFGSFVDARSSLLTWRNGQWRCAFAIAEASSVGSWIQRIAQAGLGWAYIDRYTDRWVWINWLRDSGSDYNRQVWRDDIIGFEIDSVPSGRVPSGIRIPYAWDGASKRFLFETHLSAVSSKSGHAFFNVRDQMLTVTADVNDRIDVDVATVNYTYQIPAGTYTDETLIPALRDINDTVSPFSVAFGFRIVAGENARFDFEDTVPRTVTLTAGLYTGETLATELQTQMNSVSTNWVCSYSRVTKKFTILRTSGTAQINPDPGQTAGNAANAALGFDHLVKTGASSYTSDFEVEEDRIAFAASFDFSFEFATGANGTEQAAPKSACDLLGFDGRLNTPARKWQSAHSPKGWRETTLADSAAIYGQTREIVIEGRTIYDTETARELRNRLVDWLAIPRIIVRFSTTKMPDVRRGELIRFDDLDNFGLSFPKSGSDGLWAGRRFMVLQVQQRLGPTFEQEIECIETDLVDATVPVDEEMIDLDADIIPTS